MNLKATLNGYFEKTQLPPELAPDKAAGFIKPKAAEKKTVKTEETAVAKTAAVPVAVPAPAPKTAPAEKAPEITASTFIKIVRHHHLTGSEFLSLLGNSKISNKAYQEIESNPGLTVKRLIEILEESSLTTEDYEKLIIAVHRTAQLKEEAKAKLEPAPSDESSHRPQPAAQEPAVAKQEEVSPSAAETAAGKAQPQKVGAVVPDGKSADGPVGIKLSREYEEDEDDDEDDDDEDDEKEGKKSNKGKFVVIAIAAVILIAVSFGLRYYLTGSLFPTSDSQPREQNLSDTEIFEALSALEPQTVPAFAQNDSYTAGGISEEQALTNLIMTDRRLVYCSGNVLYIFEQIGGQLEQLAAHSFDADTQLLGLVRLETGIAAVTSYEGDAYSFTYTLPEESGGETVVSGTVQRPETVIWLLDANNPENSSLSETVKLSGELTALWLQDGRLIAVTWENIPEGAAAEDSASFMPYAVNPFGDESVKLLCDPGKVAVADSPSNSSFVTVFSLDFANGAFDLSAAAGGSGQLVSKNGTDLFIGQGSLLIRYDISSGAEENGCCALSGTFGAFSAVGVSDGEVRAVTLENGSATLTVLNSELEKLSEVKNVGAGEAPAAACFNGSETYIVTQSGMLYGVGGDNKPLSESSVNVTDAQIYKWSDTVGIKVTAAGGEDKRTGLVVSACSLDGSLTVLSSIEINSSYVAEKALDEYISSPAETDVSVIGGSGENGVAVIPVVYYDGVSEVERFVICSVSQDGVISLNGSVCEYDRNSAVLLSAVSGDIVTCVLDKRIVTAKSADGSIIGYFNVS